MRNIKFTDKLTLLKVINRYIEKIDTEIILREKLIKDLSLNARSTELVSQQYHQKP